jgi:hypothetical protein
MRPPLLASAVGSHSACVAHAHAHKVHHLYDLLIRHRTTTDRPALENERGSGIAAVWPSR